MVSIKDRMYDSWLPPVSPWRSTKVGVSSTGFSSNEGAQSIDTIPPSGMFSSSLSAKSHIQTEIEKALVPKNAVPSCGCGFGQRVRSTRVRDTKEHLRIHKQEKSLGNVRSNVFF